MKATTFEPSREDLIRIAPITVGAPQTRALAAVDASSDAERQRVLFGHFAVFNEWTEVDNWEGHFFERIAPGAFKKTFAENRDRMLCVYEHGWDAYLGTKPLGPIDVLREDNVGAYYEVPLIDTDYNREFIIPAADAGLLGASFRFKAVKSRVEMPPEGSTEIPKVTHTEVAVREFGPCPIGYYKDATAALRSRAGAELVRALAERGVTDLASLLQPSTREAGSRAATETPDGAGESHSAVRTPFLERRARSQALKEPA